MHHSARLLISSLHGHISVCNVADDGAVQLIFHKRVLSVSHHMRSVNNEMMQYAATSDILFIS